MNYFGIKGILLFYEEQIITVSEMKIILVLGVFLAGVFAVEKYTTKYDNIDLDKVLNNERLFRNYIKCLLNQGRCTPEGKELREVLPDALATDCAKCTERQKQGSGKVINFILTKKPGDYEKLERLYDPKKVYRKKHIIDGKFVF